MIQANFIQMDGSKEVFDKESDLPQTQLSEEDHTETDFNSDWLENYDQDFLEEKDNQENMEQLRGDQFHRCVQNKENIQKAIIKKRKLLQESIKRQGMQSQKKRTQNPRKGTGKVHKQLKKAQK